MGLLGPCWDLHADMQVYWAELGQKNGAMVGEMFTAVDDLGNSVLSLLFPWSLCLVSGAWTSNHSPHDLCTLSTPLILLSIAQLLFWAVGTADL